MWFAVGQMRGGLLDRNFAGLGQLRPKTIVASFLNQERSVPIQVY